MECKIRVELPYNRSAARPSRPTRLAPEAAALFPAPVKGLALVVVPGAPVAVPAGPTEVELRKIGVLTGADGTGNRVVATSTVLVADDPSAMIEVNVLTTGVLITTGVLGAPGMLDATGVLDTTGVLEAAILTTGVLVYTIALVDPAGVVETTTGVATTTGVT